MKIEIRSQKSEDRSICTTDSVISVILNLAKRSEESRMSMNTGLFASHRMIPLGIINFIINPKFLFVVIAFTFISCMEEPVVYVPEFGSSSLLEETIPLTTYSKAKLDGIYELISGTNQFGDMLVGKWSGNYLTLFGGKNESYIILQAGSIDSILFFEGYWRFSQSERTGLARLTIKRNEGGRKIISNDSINGSIIIRGSVGEGSELPSQRFEIKFKKPLKKMPDNFWIIAHRGGGRNSDRLPNSENSIELIKYSEKLGANAIEIDVRFTKDTVPIIFHDDNFSPRTTIGEYMIGPVSNYTYKHISAFATLKHGEKIPTLRQVLDTVIYATQLSLVWLDTKSKNIIDTLRVIQKEYLSKALSANRKLEILIGLPSKEIADAFISLPDFNGIPSLCELDVSDVLRCNSLVWAPRWTLGTLNSDVDYIHGLQKRAFVWTLDDPEFIQSFTYVGKFDGILTNYPSIVAYHYYIKNNL